MTDRTATRSGGRVTRREVLTSAAAGGATAVAGCSANVPFLGNAFPRLTAAWLSVEESGDANVVLAFDGDVQSALETAPVSRSDVLSAAEQEGLTIEFTSVSMPRRREIDSSATTAPSRLIQGRISEFADVSEVAGRPRLSTHAVSYEKQLVEGTTADERRSDCSEYTSPLDTNHLSPVPFHVLFPDGNHYVLPDAHKLASSLESAVEDVSGTVFDYAEYEPDRTFPFIVHYVHPKLVALRMAADYRRRVINRVYHLYDIQWYQCQSFGAIRDAVAALVEQLGQEAVEDVVAAPLPEAVGAVLDLTSFHSALQSDFPELDAALQSLSELTTATQNEAWLQDLTPNSSTTPGGSKAGLYRLGLLSLAEYGLQVPLVASATSASSFQTQITSYQQLLGEQESIPNRLLSSSSTFQGVPTFGDQYWQQLHRTAVTLLRNLRASISQSRRLLEDVKTELSTGG